MLAIYLLIVAASLIGLTTTFSIYRKKHKKKVLVCPFGADCDSVIKSEFSSFMGIGLEIYGAMYYGFMAIVYASLILFPKLQTDYLILFLTAISIAALLFSAYLTFVQAFLIKTWCSWCLMSAGVSTSIFIFAMISLSISGLSFIPLLTEYKEYATMLHLFGFALGLGGATISDILFLRFLKDFKISEEERNILKLMSQIVWFALLIIVISGVGLFLPEIDSLLLSSKFITKMFIISVIIINGAILNLLITPRLLDISWKPKTMDVKKTSRYSNLSFALGSISFVSWYSAFVLGFAKSVPYSFNQLLSIYSGVVILGIIGSQIFRRIFICTNDKDSTSTIAH